MITNVYKCIQNNNEIEHKIKINNINIVFTKNFITIYKCCRIKFINKINYIDSLLSNTYNSLNINNIIYILLSYKNTKIATELYNFINNIDSTNLSKKIFLENEYILYNKLYCQKCNNNITIDNENDAIYL